MPPLKQIVEDDDTLPGKIFDLVIRILIVVSLISFSVETLPDLSPALQRALAWIELVTVGIFTMEYLLRVTVATRKLRFISSFFGLVDLIAILPFYLSTGLDLRSVRALRLLRLLKLFRYNSSIERLATAIREIKDDLVVFISGAAVVLYLAAVGIYYFEHDAQPDKFASVFDGIWWALVTMTTVGYGDSFPITVGGRLFTAVILVVGLGAIAVPTGLIASALTKSRAKESGEP